MDHAAILVSILAISASLIGFDPDVAGTRLLLTALIGPVSLSRCSWRMTLPAAGATV